MQRPVDANSRLVDDEHLDLRDCHKLDASGREVIL